MALPPDHKEDKEMKIRTVANSILTGLFAAWLAFGPACGRALADEVEESLKRAQEFYQQQKYSEAISELQMAISQIQDKQAEGYQTVLPEPPAGWSAGEIETSKVPGALMGGAVVISREYSNGQGATVTVTLMGESPAMSSILMMASNPMFLGPGYRLVRVKGHKALEEWHQDSNSGQLSVIVGSKAVVTVEGSGLSSKEVLHEFANLVDYEKIKRLMEE